MIREPSSGARGLNEDQREDQREGQREDQRIFAAALLDPALPLPDGLVGPDGEPSLKRFNVYRNNVVVGLVETLKAAYPVARRIVGDEFFAAMARVYVALEPPASPIMLDYGATFPAFVETFEPARSVPYLADVARLERAWTEAYHAAEAAAIAPAQLCEIDAQSLPQVGFTLHPSLRVVKSSFPVVQLWLMNLDGGEPTAIDIFGGGEHAVVVRPDAEVEVRRVTPAVAAFVQSFADGETVAQAASRAFGEDPAFDLAGALGELFAIDAIVGRRVQENNQDSVPIARCA